MLADFIIIIIIILETKIQLEWIVCFQSSHMNFLLRGISKHQMFERSLMKSAGVYTANHPAPTPTSFTIL